MLFRSEYVGGYEDWSGKGGKLLKVGELDASVSRASNNKSSLEKQRTVKKSDSLSSKEKKEIILTGMEIYLMVGVMEEE